MLPLVMSVPKKGIPPYLVAHFKKRFNPEVGLKTYILSDLFQLYRTLANSSGSLPLFNPDRYPDLTATFLSDTCHLSLVTFSYSIQVVASSRKSLSTSALCLVLCVKRFVFCTKRMVQRALCLVFLHQDLLIGTGCLPGWVGKTPWLCVLTPETLACPESNLSSNAGKPDCLTGDNTKTAKGNQNDSG